MPPPARSHRRDRGRRLVCRAFLVDLQGAGLFLKARDSAAGTAARSGGRWAFGTGQPVRGGQTLTLPWPGIRDLARAWGQLPGGRVPRLLGDPRDGLVALPRPLRSERRLPKCPSSRGGPGVALRCLHRVLYTSVHLDGPPASSQRIIRGCQRCMFCAEWRTESMPAISWCRRTGQS